MLKNQLWQALLLRRHQPALEAVGARLGLSLRPGWRARLELRGREGLVDLAIRWRSGLARSGVEVRVRQGLRCRRWTGEADTPAELLVERARELQAALQGEAPSGSSAA